MTYRIETLTRRMGEAITPEYYVRSSLRRYRADSLADAEYLCRALNSLTEAQHMAALTGKPKQERKHHAA